jgi:hypothetical protein
MANIVEYIISLKDAFSNELKKAEDNVKNFEKQMGHFKEKASETGNHVKEMFGMIGVSFAAFKGFELIEEGEQAVHKLHEAEAQLSNTMQNMGTYSEESFEKMVKGAGDLASGIKFSRSEILEMQSQLAMVGDVNEEEMQRITTTAANMSAKFGMGLTEAGNMLAKAVNNPEMARRLGMTLKIDPSITKHIQELAKDGKEAEARMLLVAAAESKVSGAAKAAFDADPLAKYNKQMASMKMALGEAAIETQKALAPALEWLGSMVKKVATGIVDMVHWLKENKTMLIELGVVVGVTAAGWGIYLLVQNASFVATTLLTGAITALNFVMNLNPVGVLVVAIGAFVAAIVVAWNKCVGFRAVLTGLWEVVKEFGHVVSDVFQGVWKQIHGVFTFNASEIKEGFGQTASAMAEAGQRMATAYKQGYDGVMAEDAKSKLETEKPAMAGAKASPIKSKPLTEEKAKDTSPKGASGTKSVNIHISIGKLIETFKVSATNIQESTGKVKELVAQTLLSAVNDSQIVAGI